MLLKHLEKNIVVYSCMATDVFHSAKFLINPPASLPRRLLPYELLGQNLVLLQQNSRLMTD